MLAEKLLLILFMPQPASLNAALPNSEKRSALHSSTPLMLEASNAQLACYAETTMLPWHLAVGSRLGRLKAALIEALCAAIHTPREFCREALVQDARSPPAVCSSRGRAIQARFVDFSKLCEAVCKSKLNEVLLTPSELKAAGTTAGLEVKVSWLQSRTTDEDICEQRDGYYWHRSVLRIQTLSGEWSFSFPDSGGDSKRVYTAQPVGFRALLFADCPVALQWTPLRAGTLLLKQTCDGRGDHSGDTARDAGAGAGAGADAGVGAGMRASAGGGGEHGSTSAAGSSDSRSSCRLVGGSGNVGASSGGTNAGGSGRGGGGGSAGQSGGDGGRAGGSNDPYSDPHINARGIGGGSGRGGKASRGGGSGASGRDGDGASARWPRPTQLSKMDGQDPERTASLFHDVVRAIDRGNFGLLASYMRRRAPAVVYWKNEGYATVRSLLKRHIEPVREAVHPPSVPSAKSSPSAELRIAVAVERVLLLRLATKFVHPDIAHPEVLEPDANRALDACVIAYRTAKLELDCLEKHFGAHETAAGKGEDTTAEDTDDGEPCFICGESQEAEDNVLVLCERCNAYVHQHCHEPPVACAALSGSEGDWQCGWCASGWPESVAYDVHQCRAFLTEVRQGGETYEVCRMCARAHTLLDCTQQPPTREPEAQAVHDRGSAGALKRPRDEELSDRRALTLFDTTVARQDSSRRSRNEASGARWKAAQERTRSSM